MSQGCRSWEERRCIIRAIIAEDARKPVSHFDLTPSEEIFFRARSRKAVEDLAKRTATFKAYYSLRKQKPFLRLSLILLGVICLCGIAITVLFFHRSNGTHIYTLIAAVGGIGGAAVGWIFAGGIAHRNAVRQNTTNLIFARFSQTAFTDSLHRFHSVFGYDVDEKVTVENVRRARGQGGDSSKAAEAVTYLLNYYEFVSAGVLCGDLDSEVVRSNIRGIIVYYYDKCEPYIWACNLRNRKAYESLMKLRTHYREP